MRLNYTKILQFFSNKLLTHLDFFHYLEYVSITKLLKNDSIKNEQEKIRFKYLSKHLYFMRDRDEKQLIKITEKKEESE